MFNVATQVSYRGFFFGGGKKISADFFIGGQFSCSFLGGWW